MAVPTPKKKAAAAPPQEDPLFSMCPLDLLSSCTTCVATAADVRSQSRRRPRPPWRTRRSQLSHHRPPRRLKRAILAKLRLGQWLNSLGRRFRTRSMRGRPWSPSATSWPGLHRRSLRKSRSEASGTASSSQMSILWRGMRTSQGLQPGLSRKCGTVAMLRVPSKPTAFTRPEGRCSGFNPCRNRLKCQDTCLGLTWSRA